MKKKKKKNKNSPSIERKGNKINIEYIFSYLLSIEKHGAIDQL